LLILIDGRPPVAVRPPVRRAGVLPRALEPASTDGIRVRRIVEGAGVRIRDGALGCEETSDIGGDGGSSSSGVGAPRPLVISRGVEIRGELAAESTEISVAALSNVGEPRNDMSDETIE
jgi:hypothetical protein